ncbi:MAG: hypothetical protein KIT89_08900 [Microcella sp.]|uniref:hypothetical protein n=1 Tax=Microcella sp. TaxID=1913979 RepID=UPI0024C872EB|nr:hypothetical protein [Microcella sp.]UYN82834.1 MAG: hypothetical protein KIT89_08900 [Microcella sp.]
MPALPPPSSDSIHRHDRTALRVIGVLALVGAAAALIGAVVSALLPVLSDQGLTVELLLAPGATVGDHAELAPAIRSITPESAVVTLEASTLSGGAVALLLIERALSGIIATVVGAALGYTLLRIARGEAFHRSLFAVTVAVGAALSIGTILAVGLGGLGRMMAAFELNELLGGERFLPGFTADPTVVLIGFAVLGLAYVFRIGERLQRETAGLV